MYRAIDAPTAAVIPALLNAVDFTDEDVTRARDQAPAPSISS